MIGRIAFVTNDANDPEALAAFRGWVPWTEVSDVSHGLRGNGFDISVTDG